MNLRTLFRRAPATQLSLPLDTVPARLVAAIMPASALVPQTPPPVQAQATIPFGGHESAIDSLRGALSRQLGESATVEFHDNRSTMVSFRRDSRGALRIRLHHMFLPPPADLAHHLAAFIAGHGFSRAAASHWIDTYIRGHQAVIRPARASPLGPSRGRYHDLQAIFDSLNQQFFGGGVAATIGWGRAPRQQRRRSIKMGVYFHHSQQIRLHPALDQPEVPTYLVEFVVYHEMCHQVCPPENAVAGKAHRKRIHTRAFHAREKLHPDRERALAWEKRNLKLLLRSTP